MAPFLCPLCCHAANGGARMDAVWQQLQGEMWGWLALATGALLVLATACVWLRTKAVRVAQPAYKVASTAPAPLLRAPVRPSQPPALVQRVHGKEASACPVAAPSAVVAEAAPAPAPALEPALPAAGVGDGPELPSADEALHNMWVRVLSHPPALAPAHLAVRQPPHTAPSPAALGAQSVCPECAAATVARSFLEASGHTRYFVRCSQYPQCRFLQPVSSLKNQSTQP